MSKLSYSLLFALTLLSFSSKAQICKSCFSEDRNLMLNVGGGVVSYFGDFVNPRQLGYLKPNINVELESYVSPRLSLRSELGWFQLSGDDKKANDDRVERNLSFKSSSLELNSTLALHLFKQYDRFHPRPKVNPFILGGAGIMWNNPKTMYQGDYVKLQPLQTENYKYGKIQFVIPVGVGVKFELGPFFNLIAQGGYRFTLTDYLDDVSKFRYVDPSLLKSDLSRILSDRRVEIGTQPPNPTQVGVRGHPDKKDAYVMLNLKLQYYLNSNPFKNRNNPKEKKASKTEAPVVPVVVAAAPVVLPIVQAPVVVVPVPVDTDGDGILDSLDKCPTVPGVPAYAGCPVPDTDGDGILDDVDKCPTVPGVKEYDGCPIPDSDGDGITDDVDKCPNTPGMEKYKGCPELVLYYKRSETTLDATDKANLDKVVTFLNNNPTLNVIIEGHTSTVGASDLNLRLSNERANSSMQYLISKGINKNRMKAVGYGEKYPIGNNAIEEGRAKSRRVVIKLAD